MPPILSFLWSLHRNCRLPPVSSLVVLRNRITALSSRARESLRHLAFTSLPPAISSVSLGFISTRSKNPPFLLFLFNDKCAIHSWTEGSPVIPQVSLRRRPYCPTGGSLDKKNKLSQWTRHKLGRNITDDLPASPPPSPMSPRYKQPSSIEFPRHFSPAPFDLASFRFIRLFHFSSSSDGRFSFFPPALVTRALNFIHINSRRVPRALRTCVLSVNDPR